MDPDAVTVLMPAYNEASRIGAVLAEIPDEKAGPSRAQLSMTVTGIAFAASIALAFLINALRNVLNDPEKRKIITQESS